MRPQRPLMLRMRPQHPFGGRSCSYRSLGGGGLMRPQRPLILRMRPGILLVEGVARTGLLGEGADAPPASTQVAHALSASFWGKGLLVPVCWGGRGLMRPQRPLMFQHPLGEEVLRWGGVGQGGRGVGCRRNPLKSSFHPFSSSVALQFFS